MPAGASAAAVVSSQQARTAWAAAAARPAGPPPAWVGMAPAASEQPHPGHGGMRPAAGARSPTRRAGQEIGLLCTAHRLPAPSRAAAWSLLLLRRSLIGHPDFPVSCGRETGPNGAGMLAFRNAPEAAAEPKPKLFPVFSRPSGKTAPQGRRRVRRRLRPQPAISPCLYWLFRTARRASKCPEVRAFAAAVGRHASWETPLVPDRRVDFGVCLPRPFRRSEFSEPERRAAVPARSALRPWLAAAAGAGASAQNDDVPRKP